MTAVPRETQPMAKSKDGGKKADATAVPAPKAEATPQYTVVARRYRPQQFADLVGQEHVAQAFTNAIAAGRIAHAYLFTGARGVGKTSTARILAKALNCVTGPTGTPCDVCDICKSVTRGDDVDVVEIDGASNNKVDEARELRSNVGFRPTRARFKVYIIDEVHMLTTGAFNALLKTMEEPPPHVKFILATTEVQKIPITILSRCQRFDFATVGPARIFASLQHIAQKEGIKAEDDALRVIAKRAAGSMRDSQTLLDQLLAATDGALTAATVHQLLGTASDERIFGLAEAIFAGDAKRGIEILDESTTFGLQLGELTDQLIDYWRGLMLVSVGGPGLDGLAASQAMTDKLTAHAKDTPLDRILAGLDVLTATKGKMRGSPHAQVLLEVAVVRLSRLQDLLSVADLAQWANGKAPPGPAPVAPRPAVSAAEPAKKKELTGQQVRADAEPATAFDLGAVWEQVLQQVGVMLSAYLRHSLNLPAISGPNSLVIRYPSVYTSTYELVRSDRNVELIALALQQVTGQKWSLKIELLPDEPAANGVHESPASGRARGRNEVLQLPLFQAAADVLGAQLMKLDDGFDPFAVPVTDVVAVPPTDDDPAIIPPDPEEDAS